MTNYNSSPFLFFILVAFFPFLAFSYNCHDTDRNALLSIQSSMGNPYVIIEWGQLSYNCCDWNGVYCNPSGRVTEVEILADRVNGTISPSVGDLEYLTSITLHSLIDLTGPIPSTIAKLTKLTFLRLDWNDLSGPIPAFVGELTSLTYLNLASNHFTGSIPPALGKLPLLGYIKIMRNQLTGSIPDTLSQSPSPYLYLSQNNLTGTIPKSFSKSNYQFVDLSRNRLTGDASPLFASSVLTYLDLSRNLFEFNLTEVKKLPKGIGYIDLSHNEIYGEIPKEFAERDLQLRNGFNGSYNRLCGEIPTGKGFTGLTMYEFFHNKCLCGTPLPPCNPQGLGSIGAKAVSVPSLDDWIE